MNNQASVQVFQLCLIRPFHPSFQAHHLLLVHPIYIAQKI